MPSEELHGEVHQQKLRQHPADQVLVEAVQEALQQRNLLLHPESLLIISIRREQKMEDLKLHGVIRWLVWQLKERKKS